MSRKQTTSSKEIETEWAKQDHKREYAKVGKINISPRAHITSNNICPHVNVLIVWRFAFKNIRSLGLLRCCCYLCAHLQSLYVAYVCICLAVVLRDIQ